MKPIKKVMLLGIACIMAVACSNRPATSYTIECNLQGLPDGAVVELVPGATQQKEKPVAEGVVTAGRATLAGIADEPRLFYIRVAGAYGVVKIMVENGNISVIGKAEKSERGSDIIYVFTDVEVKGSKSHDLYIQKTAPRRMLDSLYRAFQDKDIAKAVRAARVSKDKARMDSLKTTEAYKSLEADEKQFFETVGNAIKGMIMDNKETWWGPMLLLDQMSYFSKGEQLWYDEFSQEAKDSYYGQIVKRELKALEGFTGKPLPAFTLTGKDNKETTVANLSAGKKYILVDFWASWCAPCRKEIPNLRNLYKQYSLKGFEIISISTDKKEADWEKALNEEKLAWPNYLDTKGAGDACRVKAIPAIFLLDDKGTVIAQDIRGEELAAKLAELFQ
jgi:thiol-disulfide isomerase/thioredoxin